MSLKDHKKNCRGLSKISWKWWLKSGQAKKPKESTRFACLFSSSSVCTDLILPRFSSRTLSTQRPKRERERAMATLTTETLWPESYCCSSGCKKGLKIPISHRSFSCFYEISSSSKVQWSKERYVSIFYMTKVGMETLRHHTVFKNGHNVRLKWDFLGNF